MKKLYVLICSLCLIIFSSCFENSNEKKLKQGERCFISEECFGATTESNFDELNKVSNRKDMIRLKEMILEGSIYILNKSDLCTVLELKFGKCKLRVNRDSGSFNIWVSSEFVTADTSISNNEKIIDTKETNSTQPKATRKPLDFKKGETIVGTTWECNSSDFDEILTLTFITESQVTLSSKSFGKITQNYTFEYPDVTFIPEKSAKSYGHIVYHKLTVDGTYKYVCVQKSMLSYIKK
jgi:hypothetical protein